MLKISHIKIRPIHLILWVFWGFLSACYMPRGAFMTDAKMLHYTQENAIKIILPLEFQAYNYFRITYVKNREVFKTTKLNDSIIVFMPTFLMKKGTNEQFRVEAGIIPF